MKQPIACRRCGWHMTWDDQKRQFGRVVRSGRSHPRPAWRDQLRSVWSVKSVILYVSIIASLPGAHTAHLSPESPGSSAAIGAWLPATSYAIILRTRITDFTDHTDRPSPAAFPVRL
jgi:hypothetical protein